MTQWTPMGWLHFSMILIYITISVLSTNSNYRPRPLPNWRKARVDSIGLAFYCIYSQHCLSVWLLKLCDIFATADLFYQQVGHRMPFLVSSSLHGSAVALFSTTLKMFWILLCDGAESNFELRFVRHCCPRSSNDYIILMTVLSIYFYFSAAVSDVQRDFWWRLYIMQRQVFDVFLDLHLAAYWFYIYYTITDGLCYICFRRLETFFKGRSRSFANVYYAKLRRACALYGGFPMCILYDFWYWLDPWILRWWILLLSGGIYCLDFFGAFLGGATLQLHGTTTGGD